MWGNRVSPRPCPQEGLALTQGEGATGFPHAPARRRAWPSRGGRGQPDFPTPLPVRVWGPSPQGEGATGFPHAPHPVGGFGRARPSQEEPMFICAQQDHPAPAGQLFA